MMQRPTLDTPRLQLRPITIEHLDDYHRVGSQLEIALTTRMPHPLDLPTARGVLEDVIEANQTGERLSFGVHLRESQRFIGSVRLRLKPQARRADLAYWLDREHWRRGYATEASHAVLTFAFTTLKLHRVTADHLEVNPASGRVMQKLGMTREGTLRKHALHQGRYYDLHVYGILRDEFLSAHAGRRDD